MIEYVGVDLVDKFPTLIEEGEFSTFGEDLDKLEAYNFSKLDSGKLGNSYHQWEKVGEILELKYIHKNSSNPAHDSS